MHLSEGGLGLGLLHLLVRIKARLLLHPLVLDRAPLLHRHGGGVEVAEDPREHVLFLGHAVDVDHHPPLPDLIHDDETPRLLLHHDLCY